MGINKIGFVFAAAAALAIGINSAQAAFVVEVTGITGHNGGNWPATLGHLSDMVNGNGSNNLGTGDHNPGMIVNDPDDPGTWVNNVNTDSWKHEWLGSSRLDPNTSANSKIGWVVMDFGSVVTLLENMYVWDNRYNSSSEDARDFNAYYSSGVGIDPLPAMPNSQSTTGDYDFSSGDWTQLGSTQTLTDSSSPWGVDLTIAMGGISAQYIGVEILTAGGEANRVGISQIEFTAVPEPASLALLGLGGLMMLRRSSVQVARRR